MRSALRWLRAHIWQIATLGLAALAGYLWQRRSRPVLPSRSLVDQAEALARRRAAEADAAAELAAREEARREAETVDALRRAAARRGGRAELGADLTEPARPSCLPPARD